MISTYNSSHIQVNENIAHEKVSRSHDTTNISRNDPDGFGVDQNVAYGQVLQRSINMSMNEAYAAFPRTGDYEDV